MYQCSEYCIKKIWTTSYLLKKDKTIGERLKVVLLILNDLLSLVDTDVTAKLYPVIKECLSEIKASLERKYGSQLGITSQLFNSSSNKKLQWQGKINVLATLFYDLIDKGESKKEKTPFISATKSDIQKFIACNFIDAEGQDISLGNPQ